MFSKSTDGGNTWSPQRLMTKVTMPVIWGLPNANDVRVYNYPVIAVDNSDGAHAGNLYVAMYTWTGTYLRVQSDPLDRWRHDLVAARAASPEERHSRPILPRNFSESGTGQVGVSWLDRRNDPNNIDYQAFACHLYGWRARPSPNTQLTTAFSNPRRQMGGKQLDGRLHRQHLGRPRIHRRLDGQQQRRRYARGDRRRPPQVSLNSMTHLRSSGPFRCCPSIIDHCNLYLSSRGSPIQLKVIA